MSRSKTPLAKPPTTIKILNPCGLSHSSHVSDGTLDFQYLIAHVEGLDSAAAILRSMINEIEEYWSDDPQEPSYLESSEEFQLVNTNRVFVIHGRDYGTRDTVARFLENLGLEPVILEATRPRSHSNREI